MYRATNENQAFVASKTVSIKPESQIDYKPGGEIRWLIPQYLGFVNPEKTFLKFDFQLAGNGKFCPSPSAGIHSVIRDVVVRTGDGGTTLEYLQDYNQQVANSWAYTGNDSINDKRNMFEGRSANTDGNNQLYWADPPALPRTANPAAKKLTMMIPVHNSGILNGDKIVPLAAMAGIRSQMVLDSVRKTLQYWTDQGVGYSQGYLNTTAKAVGADVAAAGAAGIFTVQLSATSRVAGDGSTMPAALAKNMGLFIGDMLYIQENGDANSTGEQLGVITEFAQANDDLGAASILVSYRPNRAIGVGLTGFVPAAGGGAVGYTTLTSRVYVEAEDRMTTQTYTDAGITTPGIDWTISNLEMITETVQPPAAYVNAMMSQVGSDKGLNFDYKTYTTYKNNIIATSGLTTSNINAEQTRAYSILSRPVLADQTSALLDNSFRGFLDGAQNYQYVMGGQLVPAGRDVKLNRLSQTPRKPDALALIELEKALTNCGYTVRDTSDPGGVKFLIGRGLSKYGQVANLANQDLALRVEYGAGATSKLMVHTICGLNRLNISKSGSVVIR